MKRLFSFFFLVFLVSFAGSCTKDSPVPEDQKAINDKPAEETPDEVDPIELLNLLLSGSNVHGVKFDTPQIQLHVMVGQAFFLSFANTYLTNIIDGKVASMPAEQVIKSAW